MIKRTWPYGTRRRGRMIGIQALMGRMMQLVEDDAREGHILVGDAGDLRARIGEEGTLMFTRGGPTGGYWKFTKDNS